MDRLYILAIAIVVGGALNGGVYTVSGSGNGFSVILNRFTGNSWYCVGVCTPQTTRNSN